MSADDSATGPLAGGVPNSPAPDAVPDRPRSAAVETFSAHAPIYTAVRRKLIPDFDRFYGTVLTAIESAAARPIERILDLGAGTGLLSAIVADAYPDARVELLDGSAEMLAEAQEALGERIAAVHVQDFNDPLPPGPYDAVVSAMAIHHLSDEEKRSLFSRVLAILAPGGVLVNADQTGGPTPQLTEFYVRQWIAHCRANGVTEQELADSLERRRHDRVADALAQTRWLAEAGYDPVDLPYRNGERAVFLARRPTSA